MKTSRTVLLFIILFGTMFLFGFVENTKGVTFPLINADYNLSHELQGMMVSILSFSYVLFCLIGGIIIGRFGVKKAFATGFLILILGLGATFFMPNFPALFAALFLVFAAIGLFEVSTNALATQVFVFKAALLMNLLHFFYGAGSSLSPRAAGALSVALSWRHVYLFTIPFVLVLLVLFFFTRFPKTASEENGHDKPKEKSVSFFTALKTPMVWVFSLTLGIMVAVELCSANWGGLYFQNVYQLDPRIKGAAFVSNFYIMFTISRLLSGFAIEKIGYMRSLYIAAFATILVFILGFSLGANGIYVLPALGFFTAIFWPTVMATAMGYFRDQAPVMTSAIIVIAGIINSLIQFIMGFTSRLIGPAWGYRSGLFYALLIVITLVVLTRCMRRPYKPLPDGPLPNEDSP